VDTPIPKRILEMAEKYDVKVSRDTEMCDRNQAAYAHEIWLGEFDDPGIELAAFFHELAHLKANKMVMRRGSSLSQLSCEGLAWELGFGLAFENGYHWGYDSKQAKYARKCLFSYLGHEVTEQEIEEVEKNDEE